LLPRDVFELKAISERQPELAPAANLQVDLIEAVRRVQGRITTPWIETAAETLSARLAAGQPLLEFAHMSLTRRRRPNCMRWDAARRCRT
jgi:hypothetical protein